MTDKTYDSFADEVWQVLSRTETSDHIDTIAATGKRPAVSYLSWSTAWMLLKRKFPASTYAHRPDIHHLDNTVEVEVDVVISKNGSGQQFTNARLGVMNNYYQPIENPSARQINDSRQRALVKALAFAGLGLNLWSDSAIPVGKLDDPITEAQVGVLEALLAESETDLLTFLRWCETESLADLPSERFASARGLLQAKINRINAAKAEKKLRSGK